MKKDDNSSEKQVALDKTLEAVNSTLHENNRRLKRIEDTLWPPEGSSTRGNPNPPPYDPVGMQASLEKINKTLSELKGTDERFEERLERVIRAVNKLSHDVREHHKTMEQLRQMLGAPAAG